MTREKAQLFAPIIAAYAAGKAIEFRVSEDDSWEEIVPSFSENPNLYRIKPEPVTRPWSKPEDVPGPVCWLRHKDQFERSISGRIEGMICSVSDKGVEWFTGREKFLAWNTDRWQWAEYSTDRKTWHPCVVTEEPK